MIDNWRWVGVPFYLRTGKRMSVRDTEIVICFKPAPMRSSATPKSMSCTDYLRSRSSPMKACGSTCWPNGLAGTEDGQHRAGLRLQGFLRNAAVHRYET
jgi:hypothetical protein